MMAEADYNTPRSGRELCVTRVAVRICVLPLPRSPRSCWQTRRLGVSSRLLGRQVPFTVVLELGVRD